MEKKILIGRFFREPMREFLQTLNTAALASREATQTERAIRKIQYSLDNDFRAGFAPRAHGLDAHSLASRELAKLEETLKADLAAQELAQVRAQLAAAETLVMQLQQRVSELDHSRGSLQFIERQREIAEARRRAG
jgi:hypothetical protein